MGNNNLYERTKLAAYYLWDETGCDRALELWYCAEDAACFLEQSNITDSVTVYGITKLGRLSEAYIWFVRNIAFRLYVYTGETDELRNWYTAERLIGSEAWVGAVTGMAGLLREAGCEARSGEVRARYSGKSPE
jgi:hypothetical protein